MAADWNYNTRKIPQPLTGEDEGIFVLVAGEPRFVFWDAADGKFYSDEDCDSGCTPAEIQAWKRLDRTGL